MSAAVEDVGPLQGMVVVDLSRALAGPIAGMILGDLGARVIKVEEPGSGDDSRTWGPPFVGPEDDPQSSYFMAANRNKESLRLDLKDTRGADLIRRLVRRADVLIDNFRPGVMARLGLSTEMLEELNPRLVVLSITGFGHDGPAGRRAGYDQIAQGEAGLMAVTGPPGEPTRIGVPIADVLAGVHGAAGVNAALAARERTGRGMVVRTSLLAAAVSAHTFHGTRWTVAHEQGEPTGNHHAQLAPYGTFRCADGVVQVAVASQGLWQRFAPIAELDPQDPRFATAAERFVRREELAKEIERSFADRPRDQLLGELEAAGVPSGLIRSIAEVYEWEQTRSQGLLVEVAHSVAGRIQLPGPALRLERADGRSVARRAHTAPPTLGQHDADIVRWLAATAADYGEPELDATDRPDPGRAGATPRKDPSA